MEEKVEINGSVANKNISQIQAQVLYISDNI